MHDQTQDRAAISFGPFRLWPAERLIERDGMPLKLGGRALDILIALIDQAGRVVSQADLVARVWPELTVDEGSLRVHVAALRKALGDGQGGARYVVTVPRRGYSFVAQLGGGAEAAAPPAPSTPVRTNLPFHGSELVGRDEALAEITNMIFSHRLVTLTGIGGIGKTRLAVEAARGLAATFPDGICFVDLARLSDASLVPSMVAAAIGLEFPDGTVTAERIARSIASEYLLIVLDNCEHVIESVAEVTETLLQGCSRLRILATSQEPMRATGERLFRVPPLLAAPGDDGNWEESLKYSAVQLFVGLLRAAEPRLPFDRMNATAAAAICRRLDGIPLAIELAAARAATIGTEEVAKHLDDRFRVLTGGRRSAISRHRTLRRTLDWSYDLLSGPEQRLLCCLGCFAGTFSFEAASAIGAALRLTQTEIIEGVANLVAKSLIVTGISRGAVQYRLLETVRAYALERLPMQGDSEAVSRAHAMFYVGLLTRAEDEWQTQAPGDWIDAYGHEIDNVRSALDWAFSPQGDTAIGIKLTLLACPLWFLLSLSVESSARIEQALSHLGTPDRHCTRDVMRLHAELALAFFRRASEKKGAWSIVAALAEEVGDIEHKILSRFGLIASRMHAGDTKNPYQMADELAAMLSESASPEIVEFIELMISTTLQRSGHTREAQLHHRKAAACYAASHATSTQWTPLRFNRRVHLSSTWLDSELSLGFVDHAVAIAEEEIGYAYTTRHSLTIISALWWGSAFVALFAGRLDLAETYIQDLILRAKRNDAEEPYIIGQCLRGLLLIEHGDHDRAVLLLRTGTAQLRARGSNVYRVVFASGLARGLGGAGRVDEGLSVIETEIAVAEQQQDRWHMPEMLRVKGELALRSTMKDSGQIGEACFLAARDLARQQEALFWEMKAANSLAALWLDRGRADDALALLQPLYRRFTEGFGTPPLRQARALIDKCSRLSAVPGLASPHKASH